MNLGIGERCLPDLMADSLGLTLVVEWADLSSNDLNVKQLRRIKLSRPKVQLSSKDIRNRQRVPNSGRWFRKVAEYWEKRSIEGNDREAKRVNRATLSLCDETVGSLSRVRQNLRGCYQQLACKSRCKRQAMKGKRSEGPVNRKLNDCPRYRNRIRC